MAGNEEEELVEVKNTLEPQHEPAQEGGWKEKISLAMQLFLAVIIYFYVVIIIFFVLVVPASITPILNHPVNDSGRNSSISNG